MKKSRKRGIELQMLAWWIIAIVVLVIMIVAYLIISGKGSAAIEYIKNLFSFGRK